MAINEIKRGSATQQGNPARQGFYKANTSTGGAVIAEWREYEKSEGKRWWTYVTDDPTVEKTRVPLDGVISYSKVDDAEVARFLKRELTREEQIEDTYRRYCQNRDTYPLVRRSVPPARQLQVGQAALVGQHLGAVVVGVFEDGEVLVLEYRSDKPRGGGDAPLTMNAWHWMSVLPVVPSVAASLAYTPSYSVQTYMATPLGALLRRMYLEGVRDNPDYQREYVWTQEDKDRYLDTLFAGRPLGNFIFVRHHDGQSDELLDGKQRLSTLLELVMSVLPYRGVYWHEMSGEDRNTVLQRTAQYADLDSEQYTRADFYEIFLEVNRAGVPQTEEHLNHVRALLAAERAAEAAASAL